MLFADLIRRLVHALVWARRHLRKRLAAPDAVYIARLLSPFDVAFDVGAHSGAWTVALSKLNPEGSVYAVEALPYYAEVLRLVVALLRRGNVTVLNRAVNETGEQALIVWRNSDGERLAGLTHIANQAEQLEHSVAVSGLKLDSLLPSIQPRRIRLIKMDIEGAELPALRGARTILESHQPILYLEAWAAHTQRYGYELSELFTYLEDLGYLAFLAGYGENPTPVTSSEYSGEGDLWFLTAVDARLLVG